MPADPVEEGLRLGLHRLERVHMDALRAEARRPGSDLGAVAAVIDELGMPVEGALQIALHHPLGPFVDIVRDGPRERIADQVDQPDVGQRGGQPRHRLRQRRALGVVGAGLALQIPLGGRGEEALVPGHPPRENRVVGEEVGLLRGGHEQSRLRAQLHGERAGAAFHRAHDHEVGHEVGRKNGHGIGRPIGQRLGTAPAHPSWCLPSGSRTPVQMSRASASVLGLPGLPMRPRARVMPRPRCQAALAAQRPARPCAW